MSEQEFTKELSPTNTPLENLRTILLEADSLVQVPSGASDIKSVSPTVTKVQIARMAALLTAEPHQFLSPEEIDKILQKIRTPPTRYTNGYTSFFENKYVGDWSK